MRDIRANAAGSARRGLRQRPPNASIRALPAELTPAAGGFLDWTVRLSNARHLRLELDPAGDEGCAASSATLRALFNRCLLESRRGDRMVALRVQATSTQRAEVSELVYVRAIDVVDDDRRAVGHGLDHGKAEQLRPVHPIN
jgi:hypothetical protein